MRLRVEDVVVQTDVVWFGEDEVEIFERFGRPEALQ